MTNVFRLPDGRPASPAFLAAMRAIDAAERRKYRESDRVAVLPFRQPGTVVAVRSTPGGPRYRVCFDGTGALCWMPGFTLTPELPPVMLSAGGAR